MKTRDWSRQVAARPEQAGPLGSSAPLVPGPLLFESLLALHRRWPRQQATTRFWLFGPDGWREEHPQLPFPRDRNLRCYAHRIRAEAGVPFALVVNNLQAESLPLLRALRASVSPLTARVGIAPGPVEAGLFLGDYDRTPFGIHQDRVAILAQGVFGSRRVEIWPEHGLDAERAAALTARGKLRSPAALRLGPGALGFWPAGAWHVGGAASLSCTLNIGFGTRGGTSANPSPPLLPSELAGRISARIVAASLGPRDRPVALAMHGASLPGELHAAAKALARLGPAAIQLALLRHLASRRSALGFEPVPEARQEAAPRFARTNGDPIVALRSGRRQVFAANGHAFDVSAQSSVKDLLRALRRGATVKRPRAGAARETFDGLFAAGAIDACVG